MEEKVSIQNVCFKICNRNKKPPICRLPEHFLDLLRFCFLETVLSLAQVNSRKLSTGFNISFVDSFLKSLNNIPDENHYIKSNKKITIKFIFIPKITNKTNMYLNIMTKNIQNFPILSFFRQYCMKFTK